MKKLLLAFLLLATVACSSLSSKFGKKNDQVSTGNLEQNQAQPYETIQDEKQAAEMSRQQVEEASKEIQVDDRVFFGYDSVRVSPEAQKVLVLQVEWLKSDPQIKVIIEGHCDERGAREYNIALGEKRAKSVRDFLVKKGILSSRIRTVSYGKEKPIYQGSDEKSWAKNRRAVTVIDNES